MHDVASPNHDRRSPDNPLAEVFEKAQLFPVEMVIADQTLPQDMTVFTEIIPITNRRPFNNVSARICGR
jgi:hypothetical protein